MINDGDMYGCGTFDVSVPDHLQEKFAEFAPFIQNREIEFKVGCN